MNTQHQRDECKSILRLNNEGVSCLERGDVSTAMVALSEAFRRSKAVFHGAASAAAARDAVLLEDEGDTCCPSFSLLDHLITQQRYPHFQPLHEDNMDADVTTASSSSPGSIHSPPSCCSPLLGGSYAGPFVYRQAMYLPEVPADGLAALSRSYYSMNLTIVSAVMFNLALTHEFAGACTGTIVCCEPGFSGEVWLMKAAKLYELAFKLQRNERPGKQSLLYLMVVLNNLGQIYRDLGHEAGADRCFTQLLSMTMYIINRGRESTNSAGGSTMEEDDPGRDLVEGFIQSTAYLVLKDTNGLAPAA